MTHAGHEMAGTACKRISVSKFDDLRRGRVLLRKPIRRIEQIIDLRQRVCFLAAGHGLLSGFFRRKSPVNDRERPRQILAGLLLRLSSERSLSSKSVQQGRFGGTASRFAVSCHALDNEEWHHHEHRLSKNPCVNYQK